jgi:hypothetical protein
LHHLSENDHMQPCIVNIQMCALNFLLD